MKKKNRKIIAIVCAIALVIGSFATYTAKKTEVMADQYDGLTWAQVGSTNWYVAANNDEFPISGADQTTQMQINPTVNAGTEPIWPDYTNATLNGTAYAGYNGGAAIYISYSNLNQNAVNIFEANSAVNGHTFQIIIKYDQSGGGATTQAPSETATAAPGSTINTNGGWLNRKADGSFESAVDAAYNTEGICAVYAGEWNANQHASIDVSQTSQDPYSVPINVVDSSRNAEYITQVGYKASNLDASKTYAITLKAGNTVLYAQQVTGATTDQRLVATGYNLPVGSTTLTLDVEEASEPPTVEDITITPDSTAIAAHHNIHASWTNPTGSTKAYVYLEEVDNAHAAATLNNGWVFNDSAVQPMVAVDNVAQTRDASVKVQPGETYTLIVETYNAFDQQTGSGEVEITIPGLSPDEQELQEYLGKINTDENLALQKPVTVGSNQGDKQNITDGNNATRWQAAPAVENSYFAVDLREVCTVEKVLVSWEGSNATSYAIYTADDDGVYGGSPVATVTGLANNTAQAKLTKNLSVNARYVKIVVTGWSGNAETYGISPYELAVFGQGGALEREITFSKAWRQTTEVGANTYYSVNANWLAPADASYYKSYINVEDDDHKAKASNGWIWSDQNDGKGSPNTWVDHVICTKSNAYLVDNLSYTLIVVAYDSEGEEVARGQVTLDEKPGLTDLDYTATSDVRVQGQSAKLPCSYAIYDAESSYDMRQEAANWIDRPRTYSDEFAEVTWGVQSGLYNSPTQVTINGTDYQYSNQGPIIDAAATKVGLHANVSGGFNVGYNKVKITKGDNFVTVVFRVGGVTPPSSVYAEEQEGVPGSIRVDWVPGTGTPAEQVYRIYVDGDMKKGNLTGTSAIVNNIDAGSHTVKVVGFYSERESDGPTYDVSVSKGVKYNQDISIEGFQIRSNYPGTPPEAVSFRTMCKAPKQGSTIKANGKTYTVKAFGTSYAIDNNTQEYNGTNVLDASYTLLNETPDPGEHQWKYIGYRSYEGTNRTYGYIASDNAIITDYKSGDKDNTYYAFTMDKMTNQMAHTIWVRPFVETYEGDIVYGKSTAYTSVAEIANKLYTNSMCKNATAHEYLFTKILSSNILHDDHNPFWRDPNDEDSRITYGWNNNLYIGFRKVPDSWNGGQTDEGQYVVVGDWKIHNSSHYNEESGVMAAASYKGNSNDEMMVRVDNPGEERRTDDFMWNWGIQMKLPNTAAYSRLEDGRKYRMTVTYNSTKAGIMRIKTEGNCAAKTSEGYWQQGHDLVYDFDAVAGGNAHSIEFTYNKANYLSKPGADPSIVLCPGNFNIYTFGEVLSPTYGYDCRAMLHIKYKGQYEGTTTTVENVGGFPAGTIISDVDITFTEIDDFAPDSPNVLH